MDYSKAFQPEEPSQPKQHGLSPEKQAQLKTLMRRDPLDPAPLLEKFSRFEQPLAEMAEEVRALVVTDEASSAKCAEMSAQGSKISNEVEKAYRAEWEPYKRLGDALRTCKGSIQDRLKSIVGALEAMNMLFLSEQRRKKMEAEKKQREEAARLQREAEEKAAKEAAEAAEKARRECLELGADRDTTEACAAQAAAMMPQAPVIVAAAPNIPTSFKTDTGSQGIKTETSWEIEDFRSLPPEAFRELETHGHVRDAYGKIKAASGFPHVWVRRQVAAGVKNISGVRFFELERVVTRSK